MGVVISRIVGGLGNQMFQYAAGRFLALNVSEPFRLDVSGFAGYERHQGFEISRIFECDPEIATEEDVRDLLGWRASWIARKILFRPSFAMLHGARLVVEPHYQYWPGIREISRNAYLVGYWQSEKYFSSASETIRADFAFRHPLSKQNAELAGRIRQTTAVSLHVRRGDYASDAKTNAAHGLCSLEYYRAAVLHIAEHVERPEFFVFSDDIAWAKANLKMDFPCNYVDHNQGAESYNDMRLMSLCRHHIIANSSFSWWGAWLNPNPDKIVIAPKKWFANDNNIEDLFPAGWVAL
jgi:Glycosyl transferase family 11